MHSCGPGAQNRQAHVAERLQKEGPLQPLTSPEPTHLARCGAARWEPLRWEVYQWLSCTPASLRQTLKQRPGSKQASETQQSTGQRRGEKQTKQKRCSARSEPPPCSSRSGLWPPSDPGVCPLYAGTAGTQPNTASPASTQRGKNSQTCSVGGWHGSN